MKNLLAIAALFLFTNSSFCQSDQYSEYVKKAWALYESNSYKESAEMYKKAFDELDGKAVPGDRYNAACSYALAQDKEQSFYHLFRLAEHPAVRYKNYNHISSDSDLLSLHDDKRWSKLLELVQSNKNEAEKYLEKDLVVMLDSIYLEDQKYRRQIDEVEEQYGRDSEEMEKHWELINAKDSINLILVSNLLDERGWLGAEIVGDQGNRALFLVIQHADIDTQLKYMPMMKEAVKKGDASASSLAMLEDRVAIRQGKRQIYGSQMTRDTESGEFYVSPLVDPENVNARRAEVGLGSIEEYVQIWGLTWDVQKHIQRTKKHESLKE